MAGIADTYNTPSGYFAIGSVGNALNSLQNASNVEGVASQQTKQLKDQIAYQRRVMEQQIALKAQERIRQQMMAQAAGDAFQNSLGQFKDFKGSMDASGGQIANTFNEILSRQAPESIGPQASGAVADRIASSEQKFNDRSASEGKSLANVQALERAFSDKSINMGRNNQLAAMLSNFSQGSQGVSEQEIAARSGQLYQPRIMPPAPSTLGDLFFGLSTGGLMAANKMNQPQPTSPYAFDLSGLPQVGLKLPTDKYGLNSRSSNLGISSPRTVGD